MEIEVGDVFVSKSGVQVIVVTLIKRKVSYFHYEPKTREETGFRAMFNSSKKHFTKHYPNKDNKLSSPLWKTLHRQEGATLWK